MSSSHIWSFFFFFQAEDGIRDYKVTGVQTCALPIGINVNMAVDASPKELRATATSLLIETGSPVDRGRLLATLLGELDRLYDHAGTHGPDDIEAAYRVACDTIGKPVRIELIGSEKIEGTAEGLASDGALRLLTKNGKVLEIRAGDVVHLR